MRVGRMGMNSSMVKKQGDDEEIMQTQSSHMPRPSDYTNFNLVGEDLHLPDILNEMNDSESQFRFSKQINRIEDNFTGGTFEIQLTEMK